MVVFKSRVQRINNLYIAKSRKFEGVRYSCWVGSFHLSYMFSREVTYKKLRIVVNLVSRSFSHLKL